MKILVGTYTLFDDSEGWTIEGTSGEIRRLIQELNFVAADEVETKQRGARRTEITFTVSRPNDDEAATLEQLLFHEAAIPEEGLIQIIGRESSGGERTLYLRGHVEGFGFRHVGKRTFHTYRIIGGALRKKPPTS